MYVSNKQVTQCQQYDSNIKTKAGQIQFYLKMWVSKIPQRKKGISAVKRQLGLCVAYFKSRNIQPLLYQNQKHLLEPFPDHPCSLTVFLYLMSFLVFHSHFWWFLTVSQHRSGGLFKNKPRIRINVLLRPSPGPFAICHTGTASSQAVPAAHTTCFSIQLHYSVCIPVRVHSKRKNDFYLNLTSSEAPNVSFIISFPYLAYTNLL